MAKRKSKVNTLSYIEETPKHYDKLEKVAQKSVRKSIANSKSAGFYITYLKGSDIVREYPNGRIEVIGKAANTPRKIEEGTKIILR